MVPAGRASVRARSDAGYSATKARIITAALEQFARHGVSGTSLQMIADAIGVTKAAVYHQYPTKEEIVIAATEVDLSSLAAVLEAAEAEHDDRRALETLLTELIDLAVKRRRMVVTLLHDPIVIGLLAHHQPFQQFMRRLDRILTGNQESPEARVRAAMIAMAIGGAVTHTLVAQLDDDTLRAELQRSTFRFLDLPG